MPDPQVPPVKNPFVLSQDDLKQAAPKVAVDDKPKANPFVLDQSDLQNVKKKVGSDDSSPIPSVSSSVSQSTESDSQPKLSDLYTQTFNILNEAIPKSPDEKINANRSQLLSSVQQGDLPAIKAAKDYAITGIDKQISQIQNAGTNIGFIPGLRAPVKPVLSQDQQNEIVNLQKKRSEVENTLNQYAVHSAANEKSLQAQVRSEVASRQIDQIPNIAAEDLGKSIEKIYGALPNPAGNMQYERQKTGFAAIIDNMSMKISDLQNLGNKTQNQGLLDQADKLTKDRAVVQGKYDNLIDRFPDVAINQVSRVIGDVNAIENPNKPFISKDDVMAAARKIESKAPGFLKKYGKFVDIVAESEGSGLAALKSGLVPKGGITGGLEAGLVDLGVSGSNLVSGLIGDKETRAKGKELTEAAQYAGTLKNTPSNVVVDKDGKTMVEKPNEDFGTINWNSGVFFAGKSLPGLAGWILPETAGAKAAELLGAGEKVASAVGIAAASYYNGYDANRQIANKLIDDDSSLGTAKKNALANFNTLTTAAIFHAIGYSPTKFAEDAIYKTTLPDALKLFEESGFDNPSKKATQEFISDKVLPAVKTFASELGKSYGVGAKIAAAGLTDQLIKEAVNNVVSPGKVPNETADAMGKEFVLQSLFMGSLGSGFGTKPILEGFAKTHATVDALYDLGSRAPQYIDQINEKVATGEYSQDQGNRAISAAKTMQEEVAKVQDATNDRGNRLTVQQKAQIAAQNFRKRAAAGLKEQGSDIGAEKINSDADDQIKNVKSQSTHFELEETEAFKTAKEVDKEGNEIGAPKQVEDINPDAKYKYSKNGKETTTSGLELLSHLPQSDEYAEPEIKNSESKNAEVSNPENKNTEDKSAENKQPEIDAAANLVEKQISEGSVETPYKQTLENNPELKGDVVKELADQLKSGNENILLKDGYTPETISAIKKAFPESDVRVKDYKSPEDIQGYKPDEIMHFDQGMDNNRVTLIVDPEVKSKYSEDLAKFKKMSGTGSGMKHILRDVAKEFRAKNGHDKIIDLRGVDLSKSKEDILSSISSPKIDNNESKSESSNENGGKENGQESDAGSKKESNGQESNVKKKRGAEPLISEKQKKINSVLDQIAKHNDLKTTKGEAGAPKRALLNDIRNDVAENLPKGYEVDYKDGNIYGLKNENGKYVQKRSEINNRSAAEIDKTKYRPEVNDLVDHHVEVGNLDGVNVPSPDGRALSDRQKENALNDIRDGNDTVGAKSIYDAFEKMPEGKVQLEDRVTGQKVEVPIEDYKEAFKTPAKPLSDDEISELNKQLGDDAFSELTDDIFDQIKNEQDEPGTDNQESDNTSGKGTGVLSEETGGSENDSNASDKGGRGSEQPDSGQEGGPDKELTGIKKAVIEEERNQSDKTKINNQLTRDFPTVIEGAKKLIKDNPSYVAVLKDTIDKFLRPLTAEESVALTLRKAEVLNEHKKASQDIIDAIASGDNGAETIARAKQQILDIERDNIDRIASKTNYEKGLSLAVNKILAAADYSTEVIKNRARSKTADGKLTPEQEKKFDDLSKKLDDAQKKLDDYNEKEAKAAADKAMEEMKKNSDLGKRNKKREDKKEFLKTERKSLIEELKKEIKGENQDPNAPKTASLSPLSDKAVAIIAKLARNYVEDGVTRLADVVDNVLNDVKEHLPGITDREVRDAISGYNRPPKETISDLSRQISDIKKQSELVSKIEDVNSGKYVPKTEKGKTDPSTETVELRKKLADAMVQAGVDPYQAKALKQFKSRLAKSKEKLQGRIDKKDYSEPVKRKVVLDDQARQLQAEVNKLKNSIDREVAKIDQANRPKWDKRIDFFVKFRRAELLSSVATLGKLVSAAGERGLISPMEELAGEILQWVPGIRQISNMAPREGGGLNIGAEVLAAKIFGQKSTYQEALKELKGRGSLDALYGKEKDLPQEAIDFIGRIHSALKTPAKINEFVRSVEKRQTQAAKMGFDPLDPIVQSTIEAQAYADSKRSIFLQDNILSNKFAQLVQGLEHGSTSEKRTAAFLKFLLPITKVSTNFAWESASYAAGAVKALPYVAKALVKGYDSLTPDQADFVLRALKKQSVGLGILAMGYFNPQSVGGYYQEHEKRKEGDLKAGDVEIFGHKVPHMVLHAPLIEMLQIGATLRRVHDKAQENGEDIAPVSESGSLAAMKGLFGQVPFFNTAGTIGGAVNNAKSAEGFLGETVKSLIAPPTLQQVAKEGLPFGGALGDLDENGNPVERRPQTFTEHIESGIPGLREKVTTKDEAAAASKEKAKEKREFKKEQKEAAEAEQ